MKDLWLELFRLFALAVISFLLTEGVLVQILGMGIGPELKLQLVGILTMVLKSADRYLYESGKIKKGLIRF